MGGKGSLMQEPQRRWHWLRYEIARLATLRNLALAVVIAAATCAIVYLVLVEHWHKVAPSAPLIAASHPAVDKGSFYDLAGDKLIPPTEEVKRKVKEYLVQNGVLEGFDLYDIQAATGYSVSNVVYVERGAGWDHAVVIMPEDKYYHIYTMTFACGHTASTTPDPYRNLMFAEPDKVADCYRKQLCTDCESMRKHLDQQQPAPSSAGALK